MEAVQRVAGELDHRVPRSNRVLAHHALVLALRSLFRQLRRLGRIRRVHHDVLDRRENVQLSHERVEKLGFDLQLSRHHSVAQYRAAVESYPESALSLNALGYTLADRTEEYEEAEKLIRKALEKEPESAAIIDSLGWVLYKLGQYEEALVELERAYERLDDPEVAQPGSSTGIPVALAGQRDDPGAGNQDSSVRGSGWIGAHRPNLSLLDPRRSPPLHSRPRGAGRAFRSTAGRQQAETTSRSRFMANLPDQHSTSLVNITRRGGILLVKQR